jgi:hypothetical protein
VKHVKLKTWCGVCKIGVQSPKIADKTQRSAAGGAQKPKNGAGFFRCWPWLPYSYTTQRSDQPVEAGVCAAYRVYNRSPARLRPRGDCSMYARIYGSRRGSIPHPCAWPGGEVTSRQVAPWHSPLVARRGRAVGGLHLLHRLLHLYARVDGQAADDKGEALCSTVRTTSRRVSTHEQRRARRRRAEDE